MKMPKVSIIVPTYNVSQYLRECMDSIINQTLKEIEVIAVNDGSTDDSLNILREYEAKDSRIKVITKANSGYGHTMNVGLDAATGEYIGIVEPDDWVQPEMYGTLYEKATEHDLDFIKADFYRFLGSGDDIKLFDNRLCPSEDHYNIVVKPAEKLETFLYIMNTWSGIYKRDFINRNHIRHNETPGASFQDNGFWFQTFCLAEKAMFINRHFYMNRRDAPNSSVKSRDKVYAFNKEYAFIRSFLDKNTEKQFDPVWLVKKWHNYCFNYRRIDESYRSEFLESVKEEFSSVKDNDLSFFSKNERALLAVILTVDSDYFSSHVSEISIGKIYKYMNIPAGKLFKYRLFAPLKNKYRNILCIHDNLQKWLG